MFEVEYHHCIDSTTWKILCLWMDTSWELADAFPEIMALQMIESWPLPKMKGFKLIAKGHITMETVRSHNVKFQKGQVQLHY